jgi:hypothetical protein
MPFSNPIIGKLGEPNAHVMMRHAKLTIFVLLIVALVSTILLLIFFRPAAYLAAISVVILFSSLIMVSHLEVKARANVIRLKGATSISEEESDLNVRYAVIYRGLALTLFTAMACLIFASTMVEDWSMVGVSAAFLFLLAVFIVLPFLHLFGRGFAEDEREREKGEAVLPNDDGKIKKQGSLS